MSQVNDTHDKGFVFFVENLPYAAMILLGIIIFLLGFGFSTVAWLSAGLYAVYGIIGILWIIIFVCPHCPNFGSGCFSGYGQISATFMKKKDERIFAKKFRENIPAIIPIYVIPLIAGLVFFWQSLSYYVLLWTVAFALNSYLLAPQISKKYACANCSVKEECPWMGEGGAFKRKRKSSVQIKGDYEA